MSAAHTPGPWTFDGRFVGSGHSKANIAECRDNATGCWIDSPEAVANARLIAAAPELLVALQEAVNEVEGTFPFAFLEAAMAAIAKATGDQS